ncbi:MAG: glycosyl hydrolase family 31, partial [Bacteroidales bacterium]|nr:glycosyl hydrolase family 31 [Bacteroidales bacterium]
MSNIFSLSIAALLTSVVASAEQYKFGDGQIVVRTIAKNAVRIQYVESPVQNALPEWIYVNNDEVADADVKVNIDNKNRVVSIVDKSGKVVFTATRHQLQANTVAGEDTYEALVSFDSPEDEYLFGLGQFQDGQSNVRGLSRRLTQVNTQISIPMVLSSKGYGVLWNNYGLTEFNPCDKSIALTREEQGGHSEVVNVTTTHGGQQEVRQSNIFGATLEIDREGDYAILLDVGQKMARRHNLTIDGQTVVEMQNLWLPPTASTIVHLKKGKHTLTAELTKDDKPTVFYRYVTASTTFSSPVAQMVDYTVFVGSPDEIIATYRNLTGNAPQMPRWALGYIHCRERFHSSDEILQTANRFR